MIFQHFLLDANESNAYVAGCEATREALLVDCGAFDQRVTDFVRARELTVTTIFITHDHWDHTGGLDAYQREFPAAKVVGARAGAMPANGEIRVGEMSARILRTPGHTDDSLSLYLPGEAAVFTGDALFAGSIGGTFSEAGKRELQRNIHEQILTLPGETEVFSGHGPATSVAIEKQYNPLLG